MTLTSRSAAIRHSHQGFTLMELLVVIAILALLASLTIGAFSYAQKAAARNRTSATQAAMVSGLERYHAEFGEYPEPATPDATEDIGGKNWTIGGAAMLYQALSGDGTTMIKLANNPNRDSNGEIDDTESANVMMSDMPKDVWKRVGPNYFMVDGFGHPFQYTKGGANTDAVNPTYDLWSYGDDEQNYTEDSKAAKLDPKNSAKWITNWRK